MEAIKIIGGLIIEGAIVYVIVWGIAVLFKKPNRVMFALKWAGIVVAAMAAYTILHTLFNTAS